MNRMLSHPRESTSPSRLSPACRFLATLLAAAPLVALATASQLTPDRDGLGTHQQLGLPPCSMRMIAGIRCPACGMTTSWAYFSRASLIASFQVNSGGFLLAAYSLVFAGTAVLAATTARPPSLAVQRWLAVSLLAIGALTLVDWLVRLMR